MAKAVFHKNQRVFVKTVGTWAIVERVLPQWVKGVEEPLRVFYDVGLGREFAAHEMMAEVQSNYAQEVELGSWRVMRARNRWQLEAEASNHPVPGTYPLVVTDESEWGGWRVPGAEYDREPQKIEQQAKMIAQAPRLARLARSLVSFMVNQSDEVSQELVDIARDGARILALIYDNDVSQSSATPSVQTPDSSAA